MMHNLLLKEGDLVQVESVSLPVGTFAKFQPLSPDFLDITNPKAVLENCLRSFACLTIGDIIAVKYNQKVYELCVLETKPGNAISIIECDMNVGSKTTCLEELLKENMFDDSVKEYNTFCMHQNSFQVNASFYRQKEEIAMANSLSPSLIFS